jgi:hypothetical protein
MGLNDMSSMPCLAAGASLFLLASLSGCTSLAVMRHVPLATMSRLASLKMTDIDPDQLRVAARLPSALEPRPQGVKLQLDVASSPATPAAHEAFILESVGEPAEHSPLAAWQRPGARIWLYRLAPADVVRLRQITSGASEKGGASLSISAGVDACHRAPLDSAALPATTLLRTNASGYFVLVEDLDLRSLVSDQDIATKIPACAAR